jgi:hypothetical protein
MPELQSCYFCGEIGDALTTFDVVPDDLADESTQRTVVVCSTCHRKLDAVLAPLRTLAAGVARADDATAGSVAEQPPTADDADQPPAADDADGSVAGEGPLAPSDRADESADDTTPVSDDGGASDTVARGAATDVEADEITFDDAAGESADADDGITFSDADAERTDGTEDSLRGGVDANESGSEEADTDDGVTTDTESDDAAGTSVADAADTESAETVDADDSADASDTVSDDPPTGYRKVVRLLQNREFPVERESFVDLASNAYELEETDVSASLDRLVERGALVESSGRLQKP